MFTVIGEALLDMVQVDPHGPFVAKPGGGPLNIAVGLARLGHPTQLKARLSRSQLGATLREYAASNHVGTAACVDTDEQTTLAFAALDDARQASYEFYAQGTSDWGWTLDELADLPPETVALHTGSLAAAIAPGAEALLALWRRLAGAGGLLLSYDPNIRPDLAGPRTSAVTRVEEFVSVSHVVKASDEDVSWLYPEDGHLDVLREWSTLGPELVVMTRGEHGCVAVKANGESIQLPGIKVDVVDTIGAGDAFEAGLLSGLADARCLAPGAVAEQSVGGLASVLQRAIDVSAMTCGRAGADPPTRARYDAMRSI